MKPIPSPNCLCYLFFCSQIIRLTCLFKTKLAVAAVIVSPLPHQQRPPFVLSHILNQQSMILDWSNKQSIIEPIWSTLMMQSPIFSSLQISVSNQSALPFSKLNILIALLHLIPQHLHPISLGVPYKKIFLTSRTH